MMKVYRGVNRWIFGMYTLLLVAAAFDANGRDVIVLQKGDQPKSEREAVVVLTGFGSVYHSVRGQKKALRDQGFDVFIPDYISRKSINHSCEEFLEFAQKHGLTEYKKVHVFAYIFGSWALNRVLLEWNPSNLASIVYDRSPLQEQVPLLLHEDKPFIGKLLFGKTLKDLAYSPYTPIDTLGLSVGLMIEAKATKVAKNYKDDMVRADSIWTVESRQQPAKDHCYIWLNHDELYSKLSTVQTELFSFFRTGSFGDQAQRQYNGRDPYE